MIWVLDPIVFAICSHATPDLCYATADVAFNEYVGVHRWYLLLMLFIKCALVAFRVCRVPPLAQCVVMSVLAFNLPAEFGCLTDKTCADSADPKAWVAIRPALQPLLQFAFMGAYEDAWNMFSSIFMRYYVMFAVQASRLRRVCTHRVGVRGACAWAIARVATAACTRTFLPPVLASACHCSTCSFLPARVAVLLDVPLRPAGAAVVRDAPGEGVAAPRPQARQVGRRRRHPYAVPRARESRSQPHSRGRHERAGARSCGAWRCSPHATVGRRTRPCAETVSSSLSDFANLSARMEDSARVEEEPPPDGADGDAMASNEPVEYPV